MNADHRVRCLARARALPNFVEARVNQEADACVALLRPEDSVGWLAVCVEHEFVHPAATKGMGREWMKVPWEWCPLCRERKEAG